MRRRTLLANARYLALLAARFRVTIVLATVLALGVPLLLRALYRLPDGGGRISLLQSVHHTYFLMFGEPSLPYVESLWVEAVNLLVPPLGLAVVADGLVRFAWLFFARRSRSREWIEVIAKTMDGHVVVCGAGRVGYRVASELVSRGQESEVEAIEKAVEDMVEDAVQFAKDSPEPTASDLLDNMYVNPINFDEIREELSRNA